MSMPDKSSTKPSTKHHSLKWRPPGPVARAFFKSNAFIRGIRGPIGSGKSATCIMKLFTTACQQAPDINGKRRTRFAIFRNTYPELQSTTIKTWLEWFPEEVFGPMRGDVPISHFIRLPLPDKTVVECEVLFISADRPEDVKKVLSLEITAAFTNESRELPFDIIMAITGRVGRFPPKKDKPEHIPATEWPTECYLEMDTNAPSIGHWWYQLAEEKADGHDELMASLDELRVELEELGAIKPGQPLMEFFNQPGGRSKGAENIDNLRPGYYQFSSIGKTKEWIKVYIDNEYGSIFTGKRVYTGYSDDLHLAKAKLFPMKSLPLMLGFDFGLTPACVICQLTPRGQLRVIDVLYEENMALRQFLVSIVIPHLTREYSAWDDFKSLKQYIVTGDPSGDSGRDTDGTSCEDIMQEFFPQYESAASNDLAPRLEAVQYFLDRNLDGEAAFRLSPVCRALHEGFLGGYHFRKLNTTDVRYREVPEKNGFSHPHDALQYVAMKAYRPHQHKPQSKRGASVAADSSTGY